VLATIAERVIDLQRTLFVHIGTHKTGTTSIQNFLRSHATRLRGCGVFVPKSGTVNANSGHHNIAWEVRKDSRYSRQIDGIDSLVAELRASSESTAVISSEDFEYLVQYPRELKAFDERIEAAGFSTKYIVYFRDRDSYARSLFCELELAGFVEDFDKFRESIENLGYVRVNGDLYYEFRWDSFIKNWENILGPKIHAYSYDDAVHGIGLLPSFLAMVGASKEIIDESRVAPAVNTMFNKYQQLARELAAVKNSKSWRVTAPLRGIVSYCKRFSYRLTIAFSKKSVAAELNAHSFTGNLFNPERSPDKAKDAPHRLQSRTGIAQGRRGRSAPDCTQVSRRTPITVRNVGDAASRGK
jgi:hypothetical protein